MKKINYILFFSIFIISCNSKTNIETGFISFKNSNIQYTGRVNLTQDSAAVVYWPGTSIKIKFIGTELSVLVNDSKGDNYYNVILDNDSIFILHPDTIKTWYSLVSNIKNGEHLVEIFKRTEWDKGSTYFYGFKLGNGSKILAPLPISDKTIEFFGNSITAGYANADTIRDRSDGLFTNNYLTYAALTAHHYNANYYCTAKGGIGITISWFHLLMNDIYNRLNPEDSTSNWDFTQVTPDIVVINLFQNDAWLVNEPEFPEFKARFGSKKPSSEFIISEYSKFVAKIRGVYPNANIICALGSMDATQKNSVWPTYIQKAVIGLNDSNIYTLVFPYMEKDGHPKIKDHQEMAQILISFIDDNALWN